MKDVTEIEMENYFKQVEADLVNSPAHYTHGKFEVIDIIRDVLSSEEFEGYTKGNVIKYIFRYPYKNGLEDIKKAEVYLRWLKETLERRAENESS